MNCAESLKSGGFQFAEQSNPLNNPCIEFIRYFVLLFWLPLQNFPLAANKNYGGFAKIVSLFRDKHSVSERLRYVKP